MIATETVLTPSKARNLFYKFTGSRPSLSTIWRWARHGIDGVYLEHGFVGRKMVTSAEACHRFVAKLAEAKPKASPLKHRVDHELDKLGI